MRNNEEKRKQTESKIHADSKFLGQFNYTCHLVRILHNYLEAHSFTACSFTAHFKYSQTLEYSF